MQLSDTMKNVNISQHEFETLERNADLRKKYMNLYQAVAAQRDCTFTGMPQTYMLSPYEYKQLELFRKDVSSK